MSKNNRKYFMYLNAILSSFAVVVLHTVANPVSLGIAKIQPTFYVILCLIIGIVFSYGVPMFFMQSGANILSYRNRYDTKTFFHKRINKVVVPFVVWSILGFLLIYGHNGGTLNIKAFIQGFLSGTLVGPYWFFYNIIGFYLCAPFVSLIIIHGNRSLIKYTILLMVTVNTILPVISLVTKTNNLFGLSVPFVGSYAQYFIAGWYLTNNEISKKRTCQIYFLAIIMLLFEIGATIYFTFFYRHLAVLNYPGGIVKTFGDISMFPSFCVMCSLFLFLKDREPQLKVSTHKNILVILAGLTFGIYLIHPFVITWVLNPLNSLVHLPLIIMIITDPIFVFILSGTITFTMKKVKLINKLVP
ncbi:acyltransferase [Limosilactobacillus sp. WF-MT5-A]|uniref:acyltransferase n=1 Tax=Limosilactobacillus agrestis TaxID=2759748 RepID=UPI0015F84D4A|nr:acyltransferase [Limosilactobacillus agrestis]MBB1099666.1 acyltransferase [Limosilactobacillus agrestis]MCD7126395.1 acyltransferase [Limosilactobacillus agrestis]